MKDATLENDVMEESQRQSWGLTGVDAVLNEQEQGTFIVYAKKLHREDLEQIARFTKYTFCEMKSSDTTHDEVTALFRN